MNKVICEICGTSFQDTAEQCPICGYTRDLSSLLSKEDIEAISAPKSHSAASVQGRTDEKPKAKRTPARNASAKPAAAQNAPAQKSKVKGGKFSQANVRKRNQAGTSVRTRKREIPEEAEYPGKKESNGVLVVLLLLVIVALLAVTAYITLTYFLPNALAEDTQPTVPATEATMAAEETEPPVISCTSLVLTSGGSVCLEQIGQNWLLNVIVLPIDSTDPLVFTSSDETVATVNSEGKITAVGGGEAVITISCGDQSMECKVVCEIPAESETSDQES